MAIITLRQLLDHAAEFGYGVPAFNISNMEQSLAIVRAAQKCDSAVILQASIHARKSYAGDIMLYKMICALAEMFPRTPIVLHQDHGNSEETCLSAIRHGFSSVMMDGSLEQDAATPSNYEYNIAVTSHVAQMAHWVGASVEGELGCLGSLETGAAEGEDGSGALSKLEREQLLTDPEQAVDFVQKTKVDALAVACGSSHGAYKFSRKPDGEILAMDVIEKLHDKLPCTHLVMHGASSIPQYLQDLINEYGGKMPQTYGLPIEEIQRGIQYGVRKINIDTDCRMAMSGRFRKLAIEKPQEFDPRAFLLAGMEELGKLCEDRFERFGAAGHAHKIVPLSLDDMARRYTAGNWSENLHAK